MTISVPPKGDSSRRVDAYFAPLRVSSQDAPDMTVKIAVGSYWTALGEHREYNGGNSPTISSPTQDAKWVVISIRENGSINVINGASSGNPDLPPIPEEELPLAGIFIGDTTSVITSDMVFDIRPLWAIRPENVPDLQGELDNRTTYADVAASLTTKADIDGTPSSIFTLNKDQVGVPSGNVDLTVERGSQSNVGIRWNENPGMVGSPPVLSDGRWEFTNDGAYWGPIGMAGNEFYTQYQLDNGQLDIRYYTKTQMNDGQMNTLYFTRDNLLVDGDLDDRYYTKSEVDNIDLGADYYTKIQLDGGALNYDEQAQTGLYYTANDLTAGKLDGRYFTQNRLVIDGDLDVRYFTETELLDGELDTLYYKQTTADDTFSALGHTHNYADIDNLEIGVQLYAPIQSISGRTVKNIILVEDDITDLDKYNKVPESGSPIGPPTPGNLLMFGPGNTLADSGVTGVNIGGNHTHTHSQITDFGQGVDDILLVTPITTLADVQVNAPSDGQPVMFDVISGKFVNKFLPIDDIDGISIVSPDIKHALMFDGTSTFVNRVLIKSDISDFTSGDFVSAVGGVDEDIDGIKTFTDEIIVNGTLTVNGDTKLRVGELTIDDPFIDLNVSEINDGVGGGTPGVAGIRVYRGPNGTGSPASFPSAVLQWDEGAKQWEIGVEGNVDKVLTSGHTHLSASITDFSNRVVVELTANDINALADVLYVSVPIDREHLLYDGTDKQWKNASFATTITEELNTNSITEMVDVDTLTTVPTDDSELLFYTSGTWINRLAVKDDVSDFVETDYVHTIGSLTETITGLKTFTDNIELQGNVLITGSLFQVQSTEVHISDNVIVINDGETGNGVDNGSGTAGLLIDRGIEADVNIYWDETQNSWLAHTNKITGSLIQVEPISFEGHPHILSDITGVDATTDEINTLVGIETVDSGFDTIQQQIDDSLSRTGRDSRNFVTVDIVIVGEKELQGLPDIPTIGSAATSKTYVDAHKNDYTVHLTLDQNNFLDGLTLPTLISNEVNQLIGLNVNEVLQVQLDRKISREGDIMDDSANLTFAVGGEVLGLPATPTATAATSKEYVDAHIIDDTVHLTPPQNTYLDGLVVLFTETNTLQGIDTGTTVQAQLDLRANRVNPAVLNNIANLAADGDLQDSGWTLNDAGVAATDLWSADMIDTTKADKVIGATLNNFATLDASGNLLDSTYNHSTYALTVHTHLASDVTDWNTASDTYLNNIAILDDLSNVAISTAAEFDFMQRTGAGGWTNVSPNAVPNFVHATGNVAESITGVKTFAENTFFQNSVTITQDLTVNGSSATFNVPTTAVNGSMTISGNLVVQGDTITQGEEQIATNALILNYNAVDPASANAGGIRLHRKTDAPPLDDAILGWDETGQRWVAGLTTTIEPNSIQERIALENLTVAQPHYEFQTSLGSGSLVYTLGFGVQTPEAGKTGIQVFVNGIKQRETGQYTVDYTDPTQALITFESGVEPISGDEVEFYGFGTISSI